MSTASIMVASVNLTDGLVDQRKMRMLEELWHNYALGWSSESMTILNSEFGLPKGPIVPITVTVMLLQFVTSFPVTIFILLRIATHKKLRSVCVNYILFAMTLAEIGFLLPFILGNAYYSLVDRNELVCRITGFTVAHSLATLAGFYAQLAVNRYIAFFHHDRLPRIYSKPRIVLMLTATWLVMGCLLLPLWPYFGYDSSHACSLNAKHSLTVTIYYSALLTLTFSGSVLTAIFCNLKVSAKLRKHRCELRQHGFKAQAVKAEDFENAVRLLYFHVLVTPLFTMPLVVVRFLSGVENFPWAGRVAWLWLGVGPCVTPYLIICWMSPLRKATLEYFSGIIVSLRRENRVDNKPMGRNEPSCSSYPMQNSVMLSSVAASVDI